MSLSEKQIGLLGNSFKPSEYAFVNGNVYLKKSAIRRRLDEVDPAWSLTPPEFVAVNGDVVVMRGGLTVGGITRYDIGTAIIQRTKKSEDGKSLLPLPDYEIARNTAKAFKTAASDILARAAVQFHMGENLKDMTKAEKDSIKTPAALEGWLKKQPVFTPPPPPALIPPALTESDYKAVQELTQKHLGLSLDAALESCDLPKWDETNRAYPNRDALLKAIAGRLVDNKRTVIVYSAKTLPDKHNNPYLSLDFGFASVSVFDRQIPDVFATTAPITGWKNKDFTCEFNPPLRAFLGRGERDYPKVIRVEQMDAPEPEEAAVTSAAPLS